MLTTHEQRVINRALKIMERKLLYNRTVLSDPTAIKNWLRLRYAGIDREEFVVLFLDSQHRLIEIETLATGTLDAASIYPREIMKAALKHSAAAVVYAHNHPSGVAEPSLADRTMTERLSQALKYIDIRTLDHFVVGGTNITSFAEKGWI